MDTIESRKRAHLALSLKPSVRGDGAELSHIRLPFDALFEVSPERLDTRTQIAGIPLAFPLMFGAMTGGTELAILFNTALRRLARDNGLALCLGSMRAFLENDDLRETYGVGEVDALFANLGASEIEKYSAQLIELKCRELGCVGIFIHLNGLQEFVQPGGNRDFSCSLDTLRRFVESIDMPVFIKEVGSGIGGRCAQRLCALPIAGIETASLGGTSWVKIEAQRRESPISAVNVEALASLGYSLESSLADCRGALGNRTLIASGGIDNAVDLVKSLALGADLVAIAQPLYRAYSENGEDGLLQLVSEYLEIGRLVWRSTGCANLAELQRIL